MNKKHIAFNTHLIFFAAFFLMILGIFEACAREKEIGLSIAFGLFLLLPIFLFFISPLYFIFSDECLEIVYHFGQREQIKWSEIKSITRMGSWISKSGGFPRYEIIYPSKEKRPFFVVGEVSKTRRTKKLIKQYYKREID
jgi:hypothetical protein